MNPTKRGLGAAAFERQRQQAAVAARLNEALKARLREILAEAARNTSDEQQEPQS